MTYQTRNRTLIISEDEQIDLTPCEHNLLMTLSDNNCATYKEISEKIYGYYDDYSNCNIRVIKYKFVKKTKLKIKTVKTVGYRLETKILFE